MTGPRITPDTLGAWLVKGNADRTDLAGRVRADPVVRRWCVRPGYRARLMRAGQPVVLWASGSRPGAAPGVWGAGRLTGAAEAGPDGWSVPMELVAADPAGRVPRDRLRADPRLAGAEVLRQPQGANPSWLTVAEWAALRELLAAAGGLRAGRRGRPGPAGGG